MRELRFLESLSKFPKVRYFLSGRGRIIAQVVFVWASNFNVCLPITHDRLAVVQWVGNEHWVHLSARTGLSWAIQLLTYKMRQMDHGISAKHLQKDITYGLLAYEPSHRWDALLRSSLPPPSCFLTSRSPTHWRRLPHHGVQKSTARSPLTCMIP